jgi:hypothetical protein
MYSCDRCGKLIAAKKHDPVFITRLGRMHDKCMTRAWQEIEKIEENKLHRSEAQKARRQRELGTTSVTPTVSPSQETK